jgi:hypothetical protein
MSDVLIRTEGRAGRITLNRPKALNALTPAMCRAIDAALIAWRDDPAVALVLIDAEGERAFCAGGDIAEVYRTGIAGDYAMPRDFWRDEYRMNARIDEYPKPVVSFLQGFTMGGGVGLGCHASHRIVGESSRIAMPECTIGLAPDVGGSFILARANGALPGSGHGSARRAPPRPRRRDPRGLRRRLRARGDMARPQGPDRRDRPAARGPARAARTRDPCRGGDRMAAHFDNADTGRDPGLPRRRRQRRRPRGARRDPPQRAARHGGASRDAPPPRPRAHACARRSAMEYRYTGGRWNRATSSKASARSSSTRTRRRAGGTPASRT